MSRKASPTIIGGFVVGSIILFFGIVIIFGSGRFFRETDSFVMYFNSTVKGLDPGAPVNFKGVRIGSVKDISIISDSKTKDYFIKVIIEIERKKMLTVEAGIFDYQMYDDFIKRGLRAQLDSQSFVTGKLSIALDFYPETKIEFKNLDKSYAEIPTVPTSLEKLQYTITEAIQDFKEMPIKEIVINLNKALEGIEKIANAPEMQESIVSLKDSLNEMKKTLTILNENIKPILEDVKKTTDNSQALLSNLNNRVDPFINKLESAATAAEGAFKQIEQTVAFKEGVPGELAKSVIETSNKMQTTLIEINSALASMKNFTDTNSPFYNQLNATLFELSGAAKSVKNLSDYIEQHPESLIRGKADDGGYK